MVSQPVLRATSTLEGASGIGTQTVGYCECGKRARCPDFDNSVAQKVADRESGSTRVEVETDVHPARDLDIDSEVADKKFGSGEVATRNYCDGTARK